MADEAKDIGTAVGGVLGGPVGAVLGNLGGSIISGLFGNKANEDNIRQQERAWARDDSQVQRRVADLMAAGLHPTLAAGGGSTSQPANIEPIIRENPVEQMQQSAQRQLDMAMSKTQQELTKAQLKLVNAQTTNINTNTNKTVQETQSVKNENDFFLFNKFMRAVPFVGDIFQGRTTTSETTGPKGKTTTVTRRSRR